MEDDNLIFLLNTNKSETTTPIQQKREPLVEIVDNDDHDSIVTMTCLNDRIPPVPANNSKRHFDDIKVIRPSSANSQGSRSKKQEKVINYAPHLTSGGNRNSTDNLIQSSIDITLSTNSTPPQDRPQQQQRQRLSPVEDELAIVTIIGADDTVERENDYSIDTNSHNPLQTPIAPSKRSNLTQVQSTPDVQISRFDKDPATSKAAFARSQLAKRLSINQPQQRPIPIQSLSNTTLTTANSDLPANNDQQPSAASLAATLAASVAVSVAQPFLKLQNELEQRMNNVLDQLHQQKSHSTGVIVPVTTHRQSTETNKLYDDCVDTRMKNMEKIQEQQQQVLKQLADLVQLTKPRSKSKSKSPKREQNFSRFESDSPQQQYHFLDTLVGTSSPPVRLSKTHKKHHTHKKSSTSPSPTKRPSRVSTANPRTVKTRSPVRFQDQPPNSHFNIEPSSPYACSVCDRSRSRSRSRSPTKGLSPDSSHPRPFAPVPRPPSIMSDGFIPSSTTANALQEAYPPFDKYLNNSTPPLPLEPKPVRTLAENLDLHERVKQIDEAKNLLDENYLTLQRRKNDVARLEPSTDDSARIQRLVEQCVKQVTQQVREEVRLKLEEEDEGKEEEEKKTTTGAARKRSTTRTQLAFDRHSTIRNGKQVVSSRESTTSTKPYSDAFMEAVYGRSLYQKIKKEGKQPYFKLRNRTVQQLKQPKQIEQIPVRDTGLKPSLRVIVPPRRVMEKPAPVPPPPPVTYEPEYYTRPDGVILLGPPQIRDTRTFQPVYVPSAAKLTPHLLPSIDVDPSSKKVPFGNRSESIRVDMDDREEEEDDGQGIQIPGYQPKDYEQTYDGPRFPPTIPHDEGYRNRVYDTLQTGAIDWLEQELIARFMSQLQNQQATVPIRQHRDVLSARSSTSSSSDDRSLHDRLLDLLGQDGFQLFIDMGQPIDQDLIQALTREVLEERIAQMIGFRSPRESIHVAQPPPPPPPRTTTPTAPIVLEHHQWPQDNSVPTPQPTPPQSPPPPARQPRVVTPEITAQEISSESEPTTPRPETPREDSDRPLPSKLHHSVGTPTPSNSPSPPSTPRAPTPPPPVIIHKRDESTMTVPVEPPPPPPPVVIQPPRVPTPPPPPPPRQKTPPPVSSTSSSSTSSPSSSTSISTFSVPYSSTDTPFSDHMWFEDRSEGQIDLLDRERPQTELIMKQARRLLDQRHRYSSMTPAGMSSISPPLSPAGATHTLSIGEVPLNYPQATRTYPQQENGHTTPSGSDESNNSGKSEGEVTSSMMTNQQPQSIHIKYRRPTQGFLAKKNNKK